jgi:hypothetical protein
MSYYRDKLISASCTGRFERLKKYFDGICIEDLFLFDDDDFIDAAESTDKLLMKVFVKEQNFYDPPRFDLACPDTWPSEEAVFEKSHGVLNLTKNLVLTSFSADAAVCMPSWYETLKSSVNVNGLHLFVADNGFHDGHLMHLKQFIMSLCGKYGNLHTLDLSWNRFHGVGRGIDAKLFDTEFLDLLQSMPADGYVDITYNPMAVLDKKPFLNSLFTLHMTDAMKLIWVPEHLLGTSQWIQLIADSQLTPETISRVRAAHKGYYERRKKLKGTCKIQYMFLK